MCNHHARLRVASTRPASPAPPHSGDTGHTAAGLRVNAARCARCTLFVVVKAFEAVRGFFSNRRTHPHPAHNPRRRAARRIAPLPQFYRIAIPSGFIFEAAFGVVRVRTRRANILFLSPTGRRSHILLPRCPRFQRQAARAPLEPGCLRGISSGLQGSSCWQSRWVPVNARRRWHEKTSDGVPARGAPHINHARQVRESRGAGWRILCAGCVAAYFFGEHGATPGEGGRHYKVRGCCIPWVRHGCIFVCHINGVPPNHCRRLHATPLCG